MESINTLKGQPFQVFLTICIYFYFSNSMSAYLTHLPLEGIITLWVYAQESRQHPVLIDTKPDKMATAILKWYWSFLSSSTQ